MTFATSSVDENNFLGVIQLSNWELQRLLVFQASGKF
jgi:hypothetical protein